MRNKKADNHGFLCKAEAERLFRMKRIVYFRRLQLHKVAAWVHLKN